MWPRRARASRRGGRRLRRAGTRQRGAGPRCGAHAAAAARRALAHGPGDGGREARARALHGAQPAAQRGARVPPPADVRAGGVVRVQRRAAVPLPRARRAHRAQVLRVLRARRQGRRGARADAPDVLRERGVQDLLAVADLAHGGVWRTREAAQAHAGPAVRRVFLFSPPPSSPRGRTDA